MEGNREENLEITFVEKDFHTGHVLESRKAPEAGYPGNTYEPMTEATGKKCSKVLRILVTGRKLWH